MSLARARVSLSPRGAIGKVGSRSPTGCVMPVRGLQSRESAEIRSAVIKQIGRQLRMVFAAELDEHLSERLHAYMRLTEEREQSSGPPHKDEA